MINNQDIFNEQINENNIFNNLEREDEEELIEEDISYDKKENQNEKNININDNISEKEVSLLESNNVTRNKAKSIINQNEVITIKIKPDSLIVKENKEELINELIEKEKLLEQLITSNDELKSKINYSNKKFEEIVSKMKDQEKDKSNIENQIKKIENDIKDFKAESDKYIKQIEQLKTKLELRDIVEKESNIKILLQTEQDKNKELKNKLFNIKNINLAQKKYINQFEKQNQVKKKINELKSEIENEKNMIKLYQERYIKIENFNIMMTNKIQRIKSTIKKLGDRQNEEVKKLFTEDELNDTIGVISNLRNIINEKRNDMSNICKTNEEKIYKILSQNKIVESEINENIRMNKLLICQRNELIDCLLFSILLIKL